MFYHRLKLALSNLQAIAITTFISRAESISHLSSFFYSFLSPPKLLNLSHHQQASLLFFITLIFPQLLSYKVLSDLELSFSIC